MAPRRSPQREIQSMKSKLQAKEAKQRKRRVLQDHVAKERERVADGKKPFYLKRGDVKKRELVQKFAELKQSGRLDKFMAKRRRKNASDVHTKVPVQHRE